MAAGAQRRGTSGISASDFVVDRSMLGTRQRWSVRPCRAPGLMLRWAWLSEKDVVLYMTLLRSRLGAEAVVGPGEARTRVCWWLADICDSM